MKTLAIEIIGAILVFYAVFYKREKELSKKDLLIMILFVNFGLFLLRYAVK